MARAALLALGLPACATAPPAPQAARSGQPVEAGQALPDFVVERLHDGTKVRSSGLVGKVLLVDLWASWCAPCKKELPLLDALAAKVKADDVVVLAISIDEDAAAARAMVAGRPAWALTLVHDPGGKVADLLGPPKMPTTYLVDRQGIVRYVNAGFQEGDEARLEQQLRSLVAR